MSDGSNTFKCIQEPYKTVGAQDLLKIGYQYYGHLRKRGKREHLLASLSLKWRQKFVILSQGCVYCYGSEFSKSPASAFSLSVYERVKEIGDQANMLHCFEVLHEDPNKPPHTFACETDRKRQEWIQHIRESIDQSHKISQGSLHSDGGGSDEGIAMQPSITKRKTTRDLPPLPKIPSDAEIRVSGSPRDKRNKKPESEYDFGDEDLEEDDMYHDVDEKTFEQPQPESPTAKRVPVGRIGLPGMVGSSQSSLTSSGRNTSDPSNRPAVPLPLPKPKWAPENRESMTYEDTSATISRTTFPPASYLFDSNNKDRAKELLSSKPKGTFLLRNGRQDKEKKVLSLQTTAGVKEFQIQHKGSQVTLNNQELFEDVDRLLQYYSENNLPKNEYKQKLVKGYKS